MVTAEFVTMKIHDVAVSLSRSGTMYFGLYRGQPVPPTADPASVAHHLATGQIEEKPD
jgi:hypothetical protein